LARRERTLACERGHSFDIARSGYVNLLQPQDRRSANPGDTETAIAARRRLHDRGVTRPLAEGIAAMLHLQPDDEVLDAGCGDGFYLDHMVREAECSGRGVDISVASIDAAARRYPECEWIVANADRFVPYADASFSVVLSITARHNAPEFHRVLTRDGRLLVALPSPDDLAELRGPGRDRVQRTIEAFSKDFALTNQERVSASADFGVDEVRDVLHSIYRPLRSKPVEATRLTFSLDLLLFRPVTS